MTSRARIRKTSSPVLSRARLRVSTLVSCGPHRLLMRGRVLQKRREQDTSSLIHGREVLRMTSASQICPHALPPAVSWTLGGKKEHTEPCSVPSDERRQSQTPGEGTRGTGSPLTPSGATKWETEESKPSQTPDKWQFPFPGCRV